MSRELINQLVAGGAGVIGFVLYAALIFKPAVGAYSRVSERLAAGLLSLYVLAVFVGVGVSGALAALYFWN